MVQSAPVRRQRERIVDRPEWGGLGIKVVV